MYKEITTFILTTCAIILGILLFKTYPLIGLIVMMAILIAFRKKIPKQT